MNNSTAKIVGRRWDRSLASQTWGLCHPSAEGSLHRERRDYADLPVGLKLARK